MENISAVEWMVQQMTTIKWKMSDMTDRKAIIEQAKQIDKEKQEYFFECGRNFQLTGEGLRDWALMYTK